MLVCQQNAAIRYAKSACRWPSRWCCRHALLLQRQRLGLVRKATSMRVVETKIAQQLEATGIGKRARGRKPLERKEPEKPRRVNIVSEELCDDIIKYIGPSLERHRGCDLIDLNSGVGAWSKRLHDFLKPRKHVLMDPDADFYQPFLSKLLAKPNVELVSENGLVWKNLLDMLRAKLGQQEERLLKGANPTRNDTLLVTANLSTYPKKSYYGFDSMSKMVVYQFMASIRASSLFQRYGLIRMLLWINDEEKRRLLPRSILGRRRSALEAELSCEWIHEVAGLDTQVEKRTALRDEWINLESAINVSERMAAHGITMPPGRETMAHLQAKANADLRGQRLAGVRPPILTRPFKQELSELEQELVDSGSMDASARLRDLRIRERYAREDGEVYAGLFRDYETLSNMSDTSTEEFQRGNAAWNEKIDNFKKNARNEFNVMHDSYRFLRQDPPVLLWDRRAYEPLAIRTTEFFPNAPTALLDFQPKAMHPLFRQYGATSSRSGDMCDLLLPIWFFDTRSPVRKAMESLWSGFGNMAAACPSFKYVRRGGSPLTGHGEISARSINEQQWTEILQAWMDWPFRPTYGQMLGRLVEDPAFDADEEKEYFMF